jgi:hypothetical protein
MAANSTQRFWRRHDQNQPAWDQTIIIGAAHDGCGFCHKFCNRLKLVEQTEQDEGFAFAEPGLRKVIVMTDGLAKESALPRSHCVAPRSL